MARKKDEFKENKARLDHHEKTKGVRNGDTTNVSKLFESDGKILKDSMELRKQGNEMRKKGRPLKYSSADEMEKYLCAFMDYCIEKEIIPNVVGVCLFLGISRETWYQWMREDFPFTDTVKEFHSMIHKFMEDNTLAGNINPVLFMFLGKNYFQLKDQSETVLHTEKDRPTEEEQRRIINSIPPVK